VLPYCLDHLRDQIAFLSVTTLIGGQAEYAGSVVPF
jgi:hypothetical protein